MTDEPENIVLIHLRRIEGKLDKIGSDVVELKERIGFLEGQYGNLSRRSDLLDGRFQRIERRLDLVSAE